MNIKNTTHLISLSALLGSLLFLQGCFVYGNKDKLSLSTVVKQKENLNSTLSSVNISNNQVTITGTGFSQVSGLKIKGNNIDEELNLISKSDSQIIASAKSTLSLLVGGTFDLVIGTAEAQATYSISFTLQDGAVTASMLDRMNASSGQVLKWNGLAWAPSSLANSQVYLGTWNANTNNPDISTLGSFQNGDYYIVSTGGVYSGTTYVVGDWVMFNGTTWDRIDNTSNTVNSFHGRKGSVTLQASDYVSLKDGTTHKLTGSKLEDIADVDFSTPPTNGQVLKWNTGTSKWLPANDTGGGAGIALSDLSASAPLSYNNTTGVFSLTSSGLLALPLTGLSSGSGAITATDTILGAFGKVMSLPSDYVSKSSGGNMTTGTIALSGTAMITVPTATGVTATEVANVTYVNNQIAANGNWNKGASSSINYTAGNVGIGTTTPSAMLDVVGVAYFNSNAAVQGNSYRNLITLGNYTNHKSQTNQGAPTTLENNLFNGAASITALALNSYQLGGSGVNGLAQLELNRSSANSISHTAVSTGQNLGVISFGGSDGTDFKAGAQIIAQVNGTVSTGVVPTDLLFQTNSNGTQSERMRISSTGNVGIGTTNPAAMLDVVGNVKLSASTAGLPGSGAAIYSNNQAYGFAFNGGTEPAVIRNNAWHTVFNSSGINLNPTTYNYQIAGNKVLSRTGTAASLGTSDQVVALDSGNVGIGTTTPNSKLEVSGPMSNISNGVSHYKNVLHFFAAGSNTGTLKICAPSTATQYSMVNVRIKGYDWSSFGSWEISAGGQIQLANGWDHSSLAVVSGSPPSSQVRFAYDGTSDCMLIGNTTTVWSYPSIVVSDVIVSYQGQTGFGSGWTGSIINSEAAITSITNINPTITTLSNGNVGIGTTNPSVPLEIANSNVNTSLKITTSGAYAASMQLANASTTWTFSNEAANGKLKLSGVSGNIFSMTNDGNRFSGIGVNGTPLAPWHVTTYGSENLRLQTFINSPNSWGFFVGDTPANSTVLNTGSLTIRNLDTAADFAVLTTSTGTASPNFVIKATTGNVGIGTTSPSYTLHVNGSVAGTSAYNNLSDKRFKDHIERIPNALEKILSLEGVFYHFKSDEFPERKFSNRREMGVVAQDVEKVFPEVVTKDKDGFRSVAYSMLIAPIIEAIKEMQASMMNLLKKINGSETKQNLINNELKKEILALKEKNEKLESRLMKQNEFILNQIKLLNNRIPASQ
jgi:hypothetical protein